MPRIIHRVAAFVAVSSLAGCALDGEYLRDNPFDPDADVEIQIVAPDSTHSSQQLFTATLTASSPLPPPPLGVTWESSSPALLALGGGNFRAVTVSSQYQPITMYAYFFERVVVRTVYIGQRLETFSLWCGPAGGPAVACDATPVAPGGSLLVRSVMNDPAGIPVRNAQFLPTNRETRDPLVATPSATPTAVGTFAFNATGAGATWLVVTVAGRTDSVRVVVGP